MPLKPNVEGQRGKLGTELPKYRRPTRLLSNIPPAQPRKDDTPLAAIQALSESPSHIHSVTQSIQFNTLFYLLYTTIAAST